MNRVKAVLRNLDGTLLDSNAQHAEAWQRAFAQFGIETTFDDVVRQIGNRGEHLIPVFVPEANYERLQKPLKGFRSDLFRRECLIHLKPFPECSRGADQGKAAGIRVTIACCADEQDLENFKRIADIEDLWRRSRRRMMPNARNPRLILEAALKWVHLDPHEILVLGGAPRDIEEQAGARKYIPT